MEARGHHSHFPPLLFWDQTQVINLAALPTEPSHPVDTSFQHCPEIKQSGFCPKTPEKRKTDVFPNFLESPGRAYCPCPDYITLV